MTLLTPRHRRDPAADPTELLARYEEHLAAFKAELEQRAAAGGEPAKPDPALDELRRERAAANEALLDLTGRLMALDQRGDVIGALGPVK